MNKLIILLLTIFFIFLFCCTNKSTVLNPINSFHSISGKSTGESGNGIEKVTISLTGNDSTRTLFSDAQGLLTFSELEAGKYTITLSKDGYKFCTPQSEL